MIINSLALKIINMLLETNKGSRILLQRNVGKSFKIMLPSLNICGQIDTDGYLINHNTSNIDVIINIPLNSASYLIDHDKLAIYKKINFAGNAEFGRNILEIFSNLHLDGIYSKINSPIILFALNKLINLFKLFKNYLNLITNNATESIKEYLLYETQDLITQFESESFCQEVDEISLRTDRIESQIKQYLLAEQVTLK